MEKLQIIKQARTWMLTFISVLQEKSGSTIIKTIVVYFVALMISYAAVFLLLLSAVIAWKYLRLPNLGQLSDLVVDYFVMIITGYVPAFVCGRYYAEIGSRSTQSFAFAIIAIIFLANCFVSSTMIFLWPNLASQSNSASLLFEAISWVATWMALAQGRKLGMRERALRLRNKRGNAQWLLPTMMILSACIPPLLIILIAILSMFLPTESHRLLIKGFWGMLAISLIYVLGFARSLSSRDWELEQDEDARKPVLFLRSFQEDRRRKTVTPYQVFLVPYLVFFFPRDEDLLASAFRKFGPFLAIGCPGERLVPTGASRKYVGRDSDWRDVVQDAIAESQLVVLQVPNDPASEWGEGLCWEISQMLQRSDLDRKPVLFYLGVDDCTLGRLRELMKVLAHHNQVNHVTLPETEIKNGVFLEYQAGRLSIVCIPGRIQKFLSPLGSSFFIHRSLSRYYSGKNAHLKD